MTKAQSAYWKLAEECGELVQALAKVSKYGLKGKRRENLILEMQDVVDALKKVQEIIE